MANFLEFNKKKKRGWGVSTI